MDQQLATLAETLDKHEVDYWLNAGTLLGMIRDECLIPGDRDIDIGIWEENAPQALEAIRVLGCSEYHPTHTRNYRGSLCKIKLEPLAGNTNRTIDVDVYRRNGSHAWCPQHVSRMGRCIVSIPGTRKLYNLVSRAARSVLRSYRAHSDKPDLLNEVHTWWIPMEFLECLEKRSFLGTQFSVPKNAEAYLAFRYGDWRTPKSDWNAATDDPALVHLSPSRLCRDHSQQGSTSRAA